MASKTNKSKKSKKINQSQWLYVIILLLVALSAALIVGVSKQSKILSQYESLSHLDNQACRYLADRGADYQVNGGFALNTHSKESKAKLTYYCFTGETTTDKVIHGKPIASYALGATVKYFSSQEAAETYAKEELNPLRYWSEDPTIGIQDKNYTFIVTDEKTPYFDAYRVRKNAVVRVSLNCNSEDPDACGKQATKLLDQELKGISVENL